MIYIRTSSTRPINKYNNLKINMLDEIKIKEEITEIRSKMDAIKNNIISQKRAMSEAEQEELDALRKQINEKNEEIKALREKIDEEGKKMEKEEKMKEWDDEKRCI